MSDEQPESDSTSTDRDFYLKLANRASQRYESRRSMEWRTNVALWTLLAGGSAVIASTSSWKPSWFTAIAIFVLAVLVWLAYGLVWLRYLAESLERESKTAFFWERAAIKTGSAFEPPKALLAQHGSEPSGRWPEPGESDEGEEYLTERSWKKPIKLFLTYNSAQKAEIAFTLLLVILLSIFLFARIGPWYGL